MIIAAQLGGANQSCIEEPAVYLSDPQMVEESWRATSIFTKNYRT